MKNSTLAAILVLCLAGCSHPSPKGLGPERTRETARLAGLSLPPSAVLVMEDVEPRSAAEGHFLRLLHAGEEIRMPGESVAIPSGAALEAVTAHIPPADAGQTKGANAISAEWNNPQGTWRGVVVHTSKGYWLYLEQFKPPKP